MRPERVHLRPERVHLRPERAGSRPVWTDFSIVRADFRSFMVDFKSERAISGLKVEFSHLGGQISGLRDLRGEQTTK